MLRYVTGFLCLMCSVSVSLQTHANQDVVTLESTITGFREQPKVLYIIPWKVPEDPPSLQQWIDGKAAVSVLSPLERPVLQRQLAIYQMNNRGHQPANQQQASSAN
jgi:hypothetical protein